MKNYLNYIKELNCFKFEKGDVVTCVKDYIIDKNGRYYDLNLTLGKKYVIEHVGRDTVLIINDKGYHSDYGFNLFSNDQSDEEKNKKKWYDYKGDFVDEFNESINYIKESNCFRFEKGEMVTCIMDRLILSNGMPHLLGLTVGKNYKVMSAGYDSIYVIDDSGHNCCFSNYIFSNDLSDEEKNKKKWFDYKGNLVNFEEENKE